MITLEFLYRLMGILTGAAAVINLRDRQNPKRLTNAAFWGFWSLSFLFGTYFPDLVNAALILGMVAVATVRGVRATPGESTTLAERIASAQRWGNKLFLPALAVPLVTLAANATIGRITIGGAALVEPKQVTLVSLGLATIVALTLGVLMLRPPLRAPLVEEIGRAHV